MKEAHWSLRINLGTSKLPIPVALRMVAKPDQSLSVTMIDILAFS
jgi:hypothetical protein